MTNGGRLVCWTSRLNWGLSNVEEHISGRDTPAFVAQITFLKCSQEVADGHTSRHKIKMGTTVDDKVTVQTWIRPQLAV